MGHKNQLHILIIICIVLVYGVIACAADGVTLEILGKSVKNLPYSVEKGELLVAARPLIEALGGTVHWNGTVKVLTAYFDDGLEIRMQIGNKGITIQPGNQFKEFPVAPCQVNGTTMVSVEFFAHQFGYFYKWEESRKVARIYKPTNWVQGLSFAESLEGEVLTISSTKKIAYRSYILSEPDRLVIDLSDSALSVKASGIHKEHFAFKDIKIAQNNAETVRVVIYLNNPVQYKITDELRDGGFAVKVNFAVGIRQVELVDGGVLIRSTGEIGSTYKVILYPEPDRLVIDLPEQTLQLLKTTIPVNHPQIKQIRASQHSWEPKVVRLVLDLKEKIGYNVLRGKTANEIIIQTKNESTDTGSESKEADAPPTGQGEIPQPPTGTTGSLPAGQKDSQSEDLPTGTVAESPELVLGTVGKVYGDRELIAIGVTGGLNQKIMIHTSTPATSKIMYLPAPDRLVVDVEGVTTRLPVKLSGDKANISAVRLHQYEEKVRIVFDLVKYENHKVISDKRTQMIVIGLGQNPLMGRFIVVDPGHGGPDPGAIGPAGTHEKVINLAIAQELVKRLTAAGARVVLTRDGDQYPSLSERVDIANQLNADIFVSLHCNSHSRIDPGGTETFVAPKRQDSMGLAKAVQAKLIAANGLFNRGVKSNEFHVLVNTTMPAILVEVAFISKADEEKLLLDAGFQLKTAQAIYEGIYEYFGQIPESSGVSK